MPHSIIFCSYMYWIRSPKPTINEVTFGLLSRPNPSPCPITFGTYPPSSKKVICGTAPYWGGVEAGSCADDLRKPIHTKVNLMRKKQSHSWLFYEVLFWRVTILMFQPIQLLSFVFACKDSLLPDTLLRYKSFGFWRHSNPAILQCLCLLFFLCMVTYHMSW